MKRLIHLALILLAGCATSTPPPAGDVQVTIVAARVAQCKAAGGCALLSQAEVAAMLAEAYEMGAAAVLSSLDSHGCRRGSS